MWIRRALAPVLLTVLACAPAPPPLSKALTILVDPGPFGSVDSAAVSESRIDDWSAASAQATACTESFAAIELRRFLARAMGWTKPASRSRAPTRCPPAATCSCSPSGASASAPRLAPAAPPRGRPRTPDGFTLRGLRRDGRRVFVIAGQSRSGTLYGAYAFLEALGLRFYDLGDSGTVMPSRPVHPPGRIDLVEAPRFRTRGFWTFEAAGDRDFFRWMARNRLNLWSARDRMPRSSTSWACASRPAARACRRTTSIRARRSIRPRARAASRAIPSGTDWCPEHAAPTSRPEASTSARRTPRPGRRWPWAWPTTSARGGCARPMSSSCGRSSGVAGANVTPAACRAARPIAGSTWWRA